MEKNTLEDTFISIGYEEGFVNLLFYENRKVFNLERRTIEIKID